MLFLVFNFPGTRSLLRRGFSRDVLLAHYMYRIIPHWLSIGRTPEFEDYASREREMMVETGVWSAAECTLEALDRVSTRIWGSETPLDDERTLNLRFWPSHFGEEDVPFTEVNRAAQESVYYRDRVIVSEILSALACSRRVLVVYGCQHAVAQEATLEDLAREYGADLPRAQRDWNAIPV